MSGNTRTILAVLISILVVGAIVYLEMHRVAPTQIIPGSANVTIAPTTEEDAVSANAAPSQDVRIAQKKKQYDIAKELVHASGFINADPFTIQSLIGKKVILVDFWTYSCINCIRTLPYVEAWYEKYKDSGFVVVGVHTPEFDFEKVLANVTTAVKKFGLTYPVVLDSEYGTWGAYGNQYWPHEYLIDIDGFIAHDHIGEGDYSDTEAEIQRLLAERNAILGLTAPIPTGVVNTNATRVNSNMPLSPETYFGSNRNEYLGNGTPGKSGPQIFALQSAPLTNRIDLGGSWNIQPEYAEANEAGAIIVYQYQAQHLYFVAAGAGATATVEVKIDGKQIPAAMRGQDIDANGLLHINGNRLYEVVKDSAWGEHSIEFILKSGTLQAFTFTFG